MSQFARRSASFLPRRDSSISTNPGTKPNDASSLIASSPCACLTSSGAARRMQELLHLAKQKKLHHPETLRQQVDRLIADPRSDEFVSGFVHQWLDMERLDFFQFDVTSTEILMKAPGLPRVKRSISPSPTCFAIPKDGRIGKLLKSDYVFVNGLLATYYGIEGVTGDSSENRTTRRFARAADYSVWPPSTRWAATASYAAPSNAGHGCCVISSTIHHHQHRRTSRKSPG